MTEHPANIGAALLVAFGIVTVIGLMGLFWGWACRRPAPLALKSRAERVNPMTDGCEMDAETLGLPVPARETEGGRS